jgi:hypothetical protein
MQVVEELASIQKVKNKVELIWRLEGVVELHEEGVVELF